MTSLHFLGTGGAFDFAYGNSAALVGHRGQRLLLDCGFTVYPELARRDLTGAFGGILLTHLHCDHSGSLANLLLHRAHLQTGPPPTIWYASAPFLEDLVRLLTVQLKTPFKYADFQPLSGLAGVRSLDTFGRHSAGYKSFAYVFEDGDERLVYSGDLAEPDFLFAWLATLPPTRRTCVLHDITFAPDGGGGHTYYRALLPHFARYPELFGYHCDPTRNPPENPIPLVYDSPDWLLK
jgi:glyoxylase-like metal-dependent hydrolase (beta-lactamase superfamily II)